jgi:uncharacterized membrane protein
MSKFLKVGHFLGLAVFVGSIFGHILLGHLGDPSTDPAGFAALMQAKYMNVLVLTTSGLALLVLTGIPLMLRRGLTPKKARWMGTKLALVTLIALNGAFILTPLSRDMATAAQETVKAGALPPVYSQLKRREDLFGAGNLAMILGVIGLAVAKPFLGQRTSLTTRH